MEKESTADREKPWRPADYPAPGPSWEADDTQRDWSHRGVPDAED